MAVVPRVTPPFVLTGLSDEVLLAKFFRALGDLTRLRLLEAVMDEEMNVSELVALTGAPQGRVSSHLACLRWCGYMTTRQEGRQVYYRVTDRRVRELVKLASLLVRDNYARIRACTTIDSRGRAHRAKDARPRGRRHR